MENTRYKLTALTIAIFALMLLLPSVNHAASDSDGFVVASSSKGFDTGGSHREPASVISVPEPSILLLLVSGLAGLFYVRKKALRDKHL